MGAEALYRAFGGLFHLREQVKHLTHGNVLNDNGGNGVAVLFFITVAYAPIPVNLILVHMVVAHFQAGMAVDQVKQIAGPVAVGDLQHAVAHTVHAGRILPDKTGDLFVDFKLGTVVQPHLPVVIAKADGKGQMPLHHRGSQLFQYPAHLVYITVEPAPPDLVTAVYHQIRLLSIQGGVDQRQGVRADLAALLRICNLQDLKGVVLECQLHIYSPFSGILPFF